MGLTGHISLHIAACSLDVPLHAVAGFAFLCCLSESPHLGLQHKVLLHWEDKLGMSAGWSKQALCQHLRVSSSLLLQVQASQAHPAWLLSLQPWKRCPPPSGAMPRPCSRGCSACQV